MSEPFPLEKIKEKVGEDLAEILPALGTEEAVYQAAILFALAASEFDGVKNGYDTAVIANGRRMTIRAQYEDGRTLVELYAELQQQLEAARIRLGICPNCRNEECMADGINLWCPACDASYTTEE